MRFTLARFDGIMGASNPEEGTEEIFYPMRLWRARTKR